MSIQSKNFFFDFLSIPSLNYVHVNALIFRPETKIEGLAKLKPVFKKDGVVTAGNASVCISYMQM